MKIIPAIDVIGGKCVRLSQGDYDRVKTYGIPRDMALEYANVGFTRLHVVDLDGAKDSHIVNIDTIREVCAAASSIKVDVSGGIKSDEDVERAFAAGAAYVTIGSLAYSDTEKVKNWIKRYGADRIIIGADVKDGYICTHGWKCVTSTTIYELIERYDGMIKRVMCTDISRDGMLEGVSMALYVELKKRYPHITFIASGGVGSKQDLDELKDAGVSEVIVGKAIYEGRISLDTLMAYDDK